MRERMIIAGVNPVLEALAAGVKVDAVHLAVGLQDATRRLVEDAARRSGVRVLRTVRGELDRMAGGVVHQGVVAVCGQLPAVTLESMLAAQPSPRTLIVCLDGVQDPQNLGAVARSALAFGAVGLVTASRRSAGLGPAAMKASAGALSRLPLARVSNLVRALEMMKEAGFWICGAVVRDGQPPWEIDPGPRVGLVLGSEGEGLHRLVEERLDFRLQIPMSGPAESLNVSAAAAVLLYELLARPVVQH